MKIKYVVMNCGRGVTVSGDREIKRFDTEQEAEKHVLKMDQADLMGDVEYYIRKVWTTKR